MLTGEPQKTVEDAQKTIKTDYDKLVELFYKRLAEQRQYNQVTDILYHNNFFNTKLTSGQHALRRGLDPVAACDQW